MKLFKFLALASLVSVALAGCAVDPDVAADEEGEEEGVSQDGLSATATRLVGAYQDVGDLVRPATFRGLVLKSDGTFFADVDTGLRPFCLPGGPCPDGMTRLTGRFTAGPKYLTLSAKAGEQKTWLHGRYGYLFQGGTKLTLMRSGATFEGWHDSLSKEPSYCKKAVDCPGQNLVTPRCVGYFTCGAERTCGYRCGVLPETCAEHTSRDACESDDRCWPKLGPSWCSPSGICSRDFAYQGCQARSW
jgi:hypothetical protein